MAIRVVTDSGCDLPDALAAELGVEIVPLTIRFGDEAFLDRVELSTDEFWRRLRGSGALPETSAPSVGAFETTFRRLADEGATGIVCVNMSANLSATMQSARVAAAAVAGTVPVAVVDSRTVSMGLGNLVAGAARLAREGAGLATVVADVEDRVGRTRLYGTLATLEYLRRGGRIGNARALLGTVLSFKPLLTVRDGLVEEAGRVRTRGRALRSLAAKVHEGPVERVAVLEGGADDLDELLALIEDVVPRDEVVVGRVGSVIGTHAGPGVIGVTFQVPI